VTNPMDHKAVDLAHVRTTVKLLADHEDRTVQTLVTRLKHLDNQGAFHEIDEHTNYASAEDILAEAARVRAARD
jgi:hypothetical protein